MHLQLEFSQLKRWGFWNILGTDLYNKPEDEKIRPWYYAWSWLSRYMPPHSIFLKSDQILNKSCQILVAKYKNDFTIYLVNASSRDEFVDLKTKLKSESLILNQYIYNEKYDKNRPPFSTNKHIKADLNKGFKINLLARTFMVLTTFEN